MKPSLMKLKEEEGYEAYFEAIRNTIAGCRAKWKIFPKVELILSFQIVGNVGKGIFFNTETVAFVAFVEYDDEDWGLNIV